MSKCIKTLVHYRTQEFSFGSFIHFKLRPPPTGTYYQSDKYNYSEVNYKLPLYIKKLWLLSCEASPNRTLQLVYFSRVVAEAPWARGLKGRREWHSASARGAMRREEVTGDSCYTLCHAASVTPGGCQSPSSRTPRSLISPKPLPNMPWVVSSIHTWALAHSDCTHPVTASHRAREREKGAREGSIHLFTYGKVTNSLQALC